MEEAALRYKISSSSSSDLEIGFVICSKMAAVISVWGRTSCAAYLHTFPHLKNVLSWSHEWEKNYHMYTPKKTPTQVMQNNTIKQQLFLFTTRGFLWNHIKIIVENDPQKSYEINP
jgi:hypothetical protein